MCVVSMMAMMTENHRKNRCVSVYTGVCKDIRKVGHTNTATIGVLSKILLARDGGV